MMRQKRIFDGHMARLSALVEGGWLTVLSDQELRLWMAYAKFADREGYAYPDGRTLSRIIGHTSDSHIGAIRRALADHGLLEIAEAGGGRGKPCKIRLLNPPEFGDKPSQKPSRNPSHSGSVSKTETLPNLAINPPEFGDKPSRSGAPYKEELSKELSKELSNLPPAAPPAHTDDVQIGVPKSDQIDDLEDLPDGGCAVMVPIEPKGTKFPPGVWRRATDGVVRAYESVHRVRPIFKARGWKAFAEILIAVKGDLDEFSKIIRAALREPQRGVWEGHPPWIIFEKLNYLRSKIASGNHGPPNGQSVGKSRIDLQNEMLDKAMDEAMS